MNGPVRRRPSTAPIGIHVYRVLQEALNNVARHSGSRQAWVRLRFEPDALELEVEDHGKGLVTPAVRPRAGPGRDARARRAGRRHARVRAVPTKGEPSCAFACRWWLRDMTCVSCRIRSPFCSRTTTASCAADFAGCSKTIRRSKSSAKRATATRRSRLAASLKPAVIVMDCAMPGTSGLAATRQILDARSERSPS